jgi:hypothetical protein
MFISDKKLRAMITSGIEDYYKRNKIMLSKYIVECEVCKHLIYSDNAVQGDSIVKRTFPFGEHIHEVYYCLRCSKNHKKKGAA